MKYKYHLLKYKGRSSRLTCPQCGRKNCFAPYVDDNDNIVSPEYGRCDHESSCGYCKYPPSETNVEGYKTAYNKHQYRPVLRFALQPQQKEEAITVINTIPMDIVNRTVRVKPASDFLYFLRTVFNEETIMRLVEEYMIGVTKAGDAVFYQIDKEGRCRTGKVMKYNRETGHRIKDGSVKTPITWVHSLLIQQGVLPKEWELKQCLFGEHLLQKYPDKTVCLVEAEKTAIICSGFMPEYVWVAVGGKSQLGDRVEVLAGRTVLAIPDVDAQDAWLEKIRERPHLNIQITDFLKKRATKADLAKGADIADILIQWEFSRGEQVSEEDENPVLKELRRYFSSEYLDEVMALVEELDLEIVRVTRYKEYPQTLADNDV